MAQSIRSADDPRIEFTVASPELADDLHHAFVRFGIIAKRYTTSMGAERVEITSPDAIRLYQEKLAGSVRRRSDLWTWRHASASIPAMRDTRPKKSGRW